HPRERAPRGAEVARILRPARRLGDRSLALLRGTRPRRPGAHRARVRRHAPRPRDLLPRRPAAARARPRAIPSHHHLRRDPPRAPRPPPRPPLVVRGPPAHPRAPEPHPLPRAAPPPDHARRDLALPLHGGPLLPRGGPGRRGPLRAPLREPHALRHRGPLPPL